MAPPNSNEGNDPRLDKEMQKQLKERKQEMQLFDRFKRVVQIRLEAMTLQSEESGIKYQMGEEEKQVFRQMHGMGIKEGIAAGVVAFLVLRRGPIYIARWVYKRKLAQQQQQQRYQAPPSSDPSYQLSNPNSKNPFQVAQRLDFPRSRNFVIRSIWFTFDSVLSLMMAASVSMAYTDTDKIRDQLIGLPLLPGRSLTSDALCDDLVRELQKIKAEKHPAYQRLTKLNQQQQQQQQGDNNSMTPASYYLEGISRFSENCQRRRFVEHRTREEQGLSKDEYVEIKEPVPSNGPRLILDVNGDELQQDSSHNNTGDGTFMDSEFQDDFDWDQASEDFTTDQEQQQQSRPRKK